MTGKWEPKFKPRLVGLKLNFSCPNVRQHNSKTATEGFLIAEVCTHYPQGLGVEPEAASCQSEISLKLCVLS